MHRHKWGPWKQEIRDHIYEHSSHNSIDKVLYNIRSCESCGFVQERKGDSY